MRITKIECLELRARNVKPEDCAMGLPKMPSFLSPRKTRRTASARRCSTECHRCAAGNGQCPHLEQEHPRPCPGRERNRRRTIWNKVYEGTIYHGRLGLGIMLMSALDNALHDLRGKLLGVPAYQLLGGAARSSVTPYATLLPSMPPFLVRDSRRLPPAHRARFGHRLPRSQDGNSVL
jgi:hypothetical protein